MKHLCYGSGQQGFPGTRFPNKDDIRFLDFNLVLILVLNMNQSFIMVVYGNGNEFLSIILADHILTQKCFDLPGLGEFDLVNIKLRVFLKFLLQYAMSLFYAGVANMA